MAMAVGLDAGPAEQGGGQVRAVSKRWIALFVALAAGWGILFGYSLYGHIVEAGDGRFLGRRAA
ncbi:hypothetical protein [Methylobacterium sp. WL120]|uniref:hypothetical protein n=1 Tax=Methylobacterium sp. WL120 TaxID=2603887 RepID=UPI0011CB6117|nr:hypothetical protein [Methylobacterium sp. WL120]TXM62310.1 hypothetical protein FV229_22370 [Methylobacterium sp. WL120]